ncbi:hypothetical protein ACWEN3_32135 [Streptomyces sp. NPDC004561]
MTSAPSATSVPVNLPVPAPRSSTRGPGAGSSTQRTAAQPGLTLTAYSAAPDTPDHDKIRLLATWAATERSQPTSRIRATPDQQNR